MAAEFTSSAAVSECPFLKPELNPRTLNPKLEFTDFFVLYVCGFEDCPCQRGFQTRLQTGARRLGKMYSRSPKVGNRVKAK